VLVAGLILAAPLLASCGGAPPPSGEPTLAAEHSAQLRGYFEALASMQPARLQRAVEQATPGSAARKYAAFQGDLAAARRDDGVAPGRARVVHTARGYDICGPGPGRRRCSQFTGMDLRDGRISGFDVDGEGIADNLSVGSGEPQDLDAGGSVEFLSSYLQPSTGDYWVVFRVRATAAPIRLDLARARYARVGGRVLAPVTRSQQREVTPGTAFTAVLAFAEADIGGTVELRLRVGATEQPVDLGTAPYVPEEEPS
jgi:hypothetical protein